MIIDYETELSSKQGPIVATAASTDYLDLGSAKDVGVGDPVEAFVRITEAFNNLTSLEIAIEGDTTSAFGAPVKLSSRVVLLAGLTLNKLIALPPVGQGFGALRYLRFKYTITGAAPTTGKVTAALMPCPLAKPANVGATA